MSIHQWQKKTKNSWIEFIYTSAKAGESLDMIQKQLHKENFQFILHGKFFMRF